MDGETEDAVAARGDVKIYTPVKRLMSSLI